MTVAATSEKYTRQANRYLLYTILGLAAGIITRLSDFFPYDSLWSFSSIATLFGFWIVTVTLVIYFSDSNCNAAINVLLYLLNMNLSFYLLQYILGFYMPRFFNDGFQWNLFMFYNVLAVVCSVISFVLYNWNKENKWSSFLYALPVSGLAAETIGVGIYLSEHQMYLFQFVFNLTGLVVLGGLFFRNAANKSVFAVTLATITATMFSLFYFPFL
ncbi:hypothetical protein M3197_13795 [Sporosarcina aquimarina]|uniref:hypothetical protein n=1 Tax=Sporosarcina aquimarina TaxID=114975 RepID=UPI00203F6507|nr:hypothetical protein [Sporosarcina aquimarina]MCM3758534.1 hypothetical protein [Sporosarcina aquimarina]